MSNGLKITGLDKLQKKIDDISKNASDLEGTREVPFDELFTDKFMSVNTNFNNFDSFFEKVGIHNENEFKDFPEDKLDEFVNENSKFSSWKQMLVQASKEDTVRKLGL